MPVISLDEYANLPKGVSSEERLEHFSSGNWSPQLFFRKAIELRENAKLELQVVSDTSQLPGLGSETEFSYDHCSYVTCFDRQQAGEKFLVSVVLGKGRVIGYAIAALADNGSAEIEILDVDTSSRRSSGLKVDLTVQNETFSVGVAHLLVLAIVRTFLGRLIVNATHPPSRFIFKSLGFVARPGESNPCLLWKLPPPRD
jgi:hypothetical protein